MWLLDNHFDFATASSKKKGMGPYKMPKVEKICIDDSFLTLFGLADAWTHFIVSFPSVKELMYYKRKLKTKLSAVGSKLVKPITSIVNIINTGTTRIRKFTQIKSLPTGYSYSSSGALPKCRGIFEYRFDALTTIDHFD
mmetsp:Transcript_25012/g.28719  ORF Transcript_25012/g.28719 Transcript_25012/m.28719 type:complete len:139 (+) Transcript_25012:2450-2866(+)